MIYTVVKNPDQWRSHIIGQKASTIFKYTIRFLSFTVMVVSLTRDIFSLFLYKDEKDEDPEISSKNDLLY